MLASDTSPPAAPSRPKAFWRRWLIWVPLLLLCLAAGGLLGLKYSTTGRQAALATGYIAQVTCSCRFVSGRDMTSCDTDREPGTEIVQVEEDGAKRTITAKVPLLSKRISRFDPEFGCTLDAP